MPGRTLTFQDLISQLNQDSLVQIDTQPNEILDSLLDMPETLILAPAYLLQMSSWYNFLLIQEDGPQGFWLLADPVGATTAFDSNPYGPKAMATLTGVMAWQQGGPMVGAKSGQFNGTSTYLTATLATALGNQWSLEAWINSSSGVVAQDAISVGPITLGLNSTGKALLSDGTHNLTGTASLNGAWHHLAATWDGTTARLYVDGAQVASGVFTGNSTGTTLRIGASSTPNAFWKGQIFGAATYPRSLPASSFANHFSWATPATGLLAYTAAALGAGQLSNVNVGTVATALTSLPNRVSVRVTNPTNSVNSVFLGFNSNIVTGVPLSGQNQGVELIPGEQLAFQLTDQATLYGIAVAQTVVQVEEAADPVAQDTLGVGYGLSSYPKAPAFGANSWGQGIWGTMRWG